MRAGKKRSNRSLLLLVQFSVADQMRSHHSRPLCAADFPNPPQASRHFTRNIPGVIRVYGDPITEQKPDMAAYTTEAYCVTVVVGRRSPVDESFWRRGNEVGHGYDTATSPNS